MDWILCEHKIYNFIYNFDSQLYNSVIQGKSGKELDSQVLKSSVYWETGTGKETACRQTKEENKMRCATS